MTRSDAPQPQSADQGQLVQEDAEYTLTGSGDPLDAGYVPPDRPYVRPGDATTAAEVRDGESLDARLAREVPDDGSDDLDPSRAGRLSQEGEGVVREVGVDGGAASAEEAAMHMTDGEALEPVADDSPLGDPEVAAALDSGPRAERAERDADRDAEGDPIAGRDPGHRAGAAERLDSRPEAGGAAAPASGRDDVGPEGHLP